MVTWRSDSQTEMCAWPSLCHVMSHCVTGPIVVVNAVFYPLFATSFSWVLVPELGIIYCLTTTIYGDGQ